MTESQVTTNLEAEADNWDKDSGLGVERSLTCSTSTIATSILRHRVENGRTYHAYKVYWLLLSGVALWLGVDFQVDARKAGKYPFPNDERENDRLDLQHHLFSLTFDGKLFTAPIPIDKQLHNVLDIGTGTGIWAIEFADAHPETQVLGVDLSPIQPNFVAPNVVFQIDDLEERWSFTQKFDFIYSRMMVGGLADFPHIFKEAYQSLTPGGWIELADISFRVQSDDNSLPADSALQKWSVDFMINLIQTNENRSDLIMEGASKCGRPANTPELYKQQLQDAGYVNVEQAIYKWPQNRWPKDKKYKELGMWVVADLAPGLEGLSMALFTRYLGWSRREVEIFVAGVRSDMTNTKIHSYWNIYVVYGQKPM